MAKNIKSQKPENNETVGQAVSKTEQFFQKYGKLLTYSLIIILVIAAAIVAYFQFYLKPLKKEAIDQTFVAEQYFRAGNFESALKGDGNSLGFSQIIDEYGSKGGESVYFYAGVCELQLGNAENAINYLEKYKSDDPIIYARAQSCIGDCYVMLDKNEKAITYYTAAANQTDNIFVAAYLLKAGIISEELGKKEEALKFYQTIKEKYPQTFEGYEIDKYISRIKVSE